MVELFQEFDGEHGRRNSVSKQLRVRICCNSCSNQFDATLHRSLWIEDPSNRQLVLEDKVNAITCPRCSVTAKAEVSLLCTNVKKGLAVWYEPYPDAAVDADVKEYAKHFGSRSFYAMAPRIRTWPEFKAKILEMELQSDGMRPTIEMSSEMRNQFDGFIQDVRKKQQANVKKPPANQTSIAVITRRRCGELLALQLQTHSGPECAKQVARDTGYNDSPFFGAEKKKVRLVGELVMVNTALTIYAVNQVFPTTDSKAIIDNFLVFSKKAIFASLEQKDPTFQRRYEQRMRDYFAALSDKTPALALSFSFMTNLDLDPLANSQGQVLVAMRLGDTLSKALAALKALSLVPGHA